MHLDSIAALDFAPREVCYRCFRPSGLCLCASIPRVDNRTPILIVQHPRERTHPFNTARLVELGLSRAEVLVDYDSRLRGPDALSLPAGAGLLYPHESALDIARLAPAERPSTLVVIDGTWHHARTLYRDIPALAALPHYTLSGHHRSDFKIRRQPREHCLSTLEAIVFALQALEPDTAGLSRLLDCFRGMVDVQASMPKALGGRRRTERRQRASRAIPRALIESFDSLIVAYGESTPDPARPGGARRLVSCAAERPATGERFYCLLKTPGANAVALAHMGLTQEQLDDALTPGELERAWSAFLRPGDVLCAWNQSTLDLLRSFCARPDKSVLLKAAYFNLKRASGSLEHVVRHENILPSASEEPRAFQRLGNAVALARLLNRIGNGADGGEGLARARGGEATS
jgi:DTW domain-containing protein YfiP